MVTRRDILRSASLGAVASVMPGVVFAKAETQSRLVLVILRGAADGLAIAAPFGDPNYRKVRGELAMPEPGKDGGLLKLDELFGLHPSLAGVHDEFKKKRELVVHAVASPYRE